MFDDNAEYQAFVDKFKPKKTTDDCYTPANIYEAVAAWVAEEYHRDRSRFVRPFWPGGDYETEQYPEGCTVVDNPPFSIITRICRFYQARRVPFFLFAPTLTLFSGRGLDMSYLPCGVQITYANGAKVNTSFVTNLDTCLLRTVPELYATVSRINDANEKARTKTLPKYSFPPHVLTAAAAYQFSNYGVPFRVEKSEATFIKELDAMKAEGKDRGIFGGAFLLSEAKATERAAAERAAAERAAAHVWELSDRERAIVSTLGGSPVAAAPGPPPSPDPFDLENLMNLPKEAT